MYGVWLHTIHSVFHNEKNYSRYYLVMVFAIDFGLVTKKKKIE